MFANRAKECSIRSASRQSLYSRYLNDKEVIRKILAKIADAQMADLILTIGGIGCREEDCVPEATKAVVDKEIPGSESRCVFL